MLSNYGDSLLGNKIEITEVADALLVTEAEGILNNDNDFTIPTTAAIIDYFTANDGGIDNVVEDLTPQLGGNLDAQGFSITSFDTLQGKTGGTSSIRTGQNPVDALLFSAFDVDGATFTTFATLLAGNIPTFDLSDTVTKNGQYIYRAGGIDIPIVDGGTGASTASDARTNLGIVIGTDVQPFDATLTALAGVTTASNKLIYATGVDAFSTTDFTAFSRTLLDDVDAATMRGTLGLIIGTDIQPFDATLTALAGVTTASNKLIYAIGVDAFSTTDLSPFALTILDDLSASDVRSTLGLVIGTDVQPYNVNTALNTDKLSDFAPTTSSELAGVISDETGTGALVFASNPVVSLDSSSDIAGFQFYAQGNGLTVTIDDGGTGATNVSDARVNLGLQSMATQASTAVSITGGSITGITDLALADGGTGRSFTDPNADRIMFWDDSAGSMEWLSLGAGLSITGTTLGMTSGTYTPTYTNVANVSSFGTVSDLNYYRVGDMVTVFGRVSIDPTSASINTEFRGTLPIASNFSLFTDAGGSCVCTASAGLVGAVRAETTNNEFTVKYINTAETAAKDFALHFSYRVI